MKNLKNKIERKKPEEAKEIILSMYPGNDEPFADAFIRTYEKFIIPKTQIGLIYNGVTIIATSKHDPRVGITIKNFGKQFSWVDYGDQYSSENILSIGLSYYPKYQDKEYVVVDLPRIIKEHINCKIKYGKKSQQVILFNNYKDISSIFFEGQENNKKISNCILQTTTDSYYDEANILGNLTNQIYKKYKSLIFSKQ